MRNSIPSNLTLKYEPLKKTFTLIEKEKLSKTDLYKFDIKKDDSTYQKNVYYLDAILRSKLNVKGISLSTEASNQATICFNNTSDNFDLSNYFFTSNSHTFVKDWQYFFDNFKPLRFGKLIQGYVEFDVISANDQAYNIPYDKNLFEAYSAYPMQTCYICNNFCDVYLGEFFLKRSGMNLFLSNNEKNNILDISFSLKTASYEFENKYYMKFFFILLLCASLIALIVTFFFKRKSVNNNKNDELFEKLKPENSGI